MNWLCPLLFSILIHKTSLLKHIESEPISTALHVNSDYSNMTVTKIPGIRNGNDGDTSKKRFAFTKWGMWSKCEGGHKTRRRHCLRRDICGDSIRIEVASCFNERVQKIEHSTVEKRRAFVIPQIRQLDAAVDVQKRFRGFSPWSSWTNCSRKCTTVRKRYCIKRNFCGRKVVRQSAYCYTEGTYCHTWIRKKMQWRHDSGYTVVESMPKPAQALHREDTFKERSSSSQPCGKLGRYRGSSRTRLRGRMRDMIRIIGGRLAPRGKWPWQVVVLNRYKEAICGATLVSLRWVVTAAHCIRRVLYIRLGEHDLFLRHRGEREMKVMEAVVHPRYDPDTVHNDVAMLRLPVPANPHLGHGVACLPQPHSTLAPHTSCVILGWGKKRATDVRGTRFLHEAQVSTIQQSVCRRSYRLYAITEDMVCAGRGGRDTCAGDSGGPLLCKDKNNLYYLQAITSFGDGCGKRGKYGVYTRTAGYVTWMKSVMNNAYFD